MDPKLSAKIKRIYLNSRSPYYLSGLFSFKRHLFDKYKISISLPKLKHILRQIPIFQRLSENKNAQQKNNFRSVKVLGTNIELVGDLVYMPGSKSKNRKGPYIGFYAFVDAFSKKAYCHLAVNASGQLFRDIFTKLFITRKPKLKKYRVLRTDFGREFTSSKGYLKSVGTIWIGNKGGQNKSPILERFVKTLKTKIFNRVQASNKPLSQWWQFLSDSVSSYNSSVHSFHNMEPNKVTPFHDDFIRRRLLRKKRTQNSVYRGDFMKQYRETLKALKKFNEKYSSKSQMYEQNPNDYRKNTVVYLENSVLKDSSKAFKQKPTLSVKRDKLFRITFLNPMEKPYLYGLSELNGKRLTGLYNGKFLFLGPPKYNRNMFKRTKSKKS